MGQGQQGVGEARMRYIAPEIRFMAKIFKMPDDGCWLWRGAKNGCPDPYGMFSLDKKKRPIKAHRAAYILFVGEIPKEKPHMLHKCDTRLCVKPTHLFPGTNRDNVADCVAKDRVPKGAARTNHKLTEDEVCFIRLNRKLGGYKLAKLFNVSPGTIYHIFHYRNWKHVA